MSILNAIILGLVQGIAEFLPISSSGHLSVLQNLFHMSTAEQGHLFFDVMLHFGTLISIFIVYWKDIVQMVRELIWFFQGKGLRTGKGPDRRPLPMARLVLMIIFATLPLVLVFPIKDEVEEAERFSLPALPLSCEPPPGCIPGHTALPILNQTLNQRHEAVVKQEIDTLITGTETRFYYHGGRGRAVSLPPTPGQ